MSLTTVVRLLLVYGHLMICVFALATVLGADWRLLHGQLSARRLLLTHRRVVLLLAGLWLTGCAIVVVDGVPLTDPGSKLLAKLVCVSVLTLNGLLLRHWCFPRLISDRPLPRAEAWALMACGATSTTCWLMSAFYGIARPLTQWSPGQNLMLLAAALVLAIGVALPLASRLTLGRIARQRGAGQARHPAPGLAQAPNPAGRVATP